MSSFVAFSHLASASYQGPSPRLESAALVELLAVAFDRRTIDPEAPSGLGLGGTPVFTDWTIFSLRSNEYAFMFLSYPAQHHCNPL